MCRVKASHRLNRPFSFDLLLEYFYTYLFQPVKLVNKGRRHVKSRFNSSGPPRSIQPFFSENNPNFTISSLLGCCCRQKPTFSGYRVRVCWGAYFFLLFTTSR